MSRDTPNPFFDSGLYILNAFTHASTIVTTLRPVQKVLVTRAMKAGGPTSFGVGRLDCVDIILCYDGERSPQVVDCRRDRGNFAYCRGLHESRSSHLRAIRETVALRKPAESHSVTDWLLPTVEYHNYLIFSTTRFSNMTFTYGYFGRIQTTNDIGVFYGVVPQ